jgi:hypothetical protein
MEYKGVADSHPDWGIWEFRIVNLQLVHIFSRLNEGFARATWSTKQWLTLILFLIYN